MQRFELSGEYLSGRFKAKAFSKGIVEALGDQQDVMILKAEFIGGSADLAKAVEGNIQNICKVRGRVEFVAPGSLPNDGKVIDDVRKYT